MLHAKDRSRKKEYTDHMTHEKVNAYSETRVFEIKIVKLHNKNINFNV